MSTKVFISYSRKDQDIARNVYQELHSHGLHPWMDEEDLLPGQVWEDEIKRAMKTSDFIMILLSHQATTSKGYFQKELRIAQDLSQHVPQDQILLIPVRVNFCQVPPTLEHIHFVDLFPSYQSGIDKVLRAMNLPKPSKLNIGISLSEASPFLEEAMNWKPIDWIEHGKHENIGSDVTRREIIRAWTEENRKK